MSKLIMLYGLPASGKSTRAEKIVSQGNWYRLNRDLLSKMLHCGKWSGKNEEMTVKAERILAQDLLMAGYNVVIDDTNLNPKNREMWKSIAKSAGARFEREFIDTPVETCLLRDSLRPDSVGSHVVIQMAMRYGLFPKPENGFVLCDLDGTLCDITHRLHFVNDPTKAKDWKSFFEGIPNDVPRPEVVGLLNEYKEKGHTIIFVSARPETYRGETETWLTQTVGPLYLMVVMRRADDKRKDIEVKRQMFDELFKDKYPIETVIDDRPSVIRMWRENKVPVIDVGAGIEF